MKTLLPIFFPLFVFVAFVDVLEAQKMESKGVRDIENHMYDTLTIGTQVWMTTDLIVTKYNNGTPIPNVRGGTAWANLSTPGYSETPIKRFSVYGLWYNYYAVSDTNSLKVCPVGWHVPTDTEWMTLRDTLEGISLAGGKMKENVLELFLNDPNTNDNESLGVPGEFFNNNGAFNSTDDDGIWWSSTGGRSDTTMGQYFTCANGGLIMKGGDKRLGLHIRCLKD